MDARNIVVVLLVLLVAVSFAKKKKGGTKKRLAILEQEFAAQKQEFAAQKQINRINLKRNDELQTTIDSLHKTTVLQQTTIDSLNAKTNSQQTTIDSLNAKTNSQQTTIDSLNAKTNSQQTTIDSLNKTNVLQQTTIDSLNAKTNSQQTTIDSLNAKTNSQQTTIDSQQQAIQTISSQLNSLNTSVNTHILFSVSGRDKSTYSKGEVLKFNSIVSNPNNAYDKSTGEFKAPVTGTYVFTVSINCYYYPHNKASFYLKCGSTVVMTVVTQCTSAVNYQSASGAAIAHVTQGGVCRVEAAGDSRLGLLGPTPGHTNSFTGFLIFQN